MKEIPESSDQPSKKRKPVDPETHQDSSQENGTLRGFFPARDGTSLYYEVEGEGRPLLFLYGLMCQRDHWRHQRKEFAKQYQVITFDYRGHQASAYPRNDRNMTLQWCAWDIQDLLRYLKLEEVIVMGHSLGVPIIAHLATMEPKRLKGAVMVCGSVSNPFENMFYSNRLNLLYQQFSKLYDWAPGIATAIWKRFTVRNKFSYFLTANFGFNPTAAEEQDIRMYMQGVADTPLATFQSLINDYSNFDGREILKGIECPTLIVAGGNDCITPLYLQEEMLSLLPNGQLEVVPEGSHNAHMDYPDEVNSLIAQFLLEQKYR